MAIVLSASGRTLGTGYNGAPSGAVHCVDGGCPRAASQSSHGSSYANCVAVHAEANALLHSDRSAREGGTLVINGPPCWDCSKLIAGSGIKTVVYKEDDAYADWPKCQQLLESVGIKLHVIGATNADEPGDGSRPLGFGAEQPVDVARRSGYGTPVAGRDRAVSTLRDAALDFGHGVPYSVELDQTTQGDEQ